MRVFRVVAADGWLARWYPGPYAGFAAPGGGEAGSAPFLPRWSEESLADAAASACRESRPVSALASHLARRQAQLGGGPAAERAARLIGRGAPVVVAGQQPGLLGGPLFTLYKALTVVGLARRAEAVLGEPVVPLFWVASDDHDVSEVATALFLDAEGRATPVRLPLRPGGAPAGSLPVPPVALQAVDQAVAPGGRPWPAAAEARETFLAAARGSASLGEWFARLLAHLLGCHGLVVLDPLWPEVRELAAPALVRLAESAPELARALAVGETLSRRAGIQLAWPGGDAPLFFLRGDGVRVGLRWRDGCLCDRRGRYRLTPRELARLAAAGVVSPGAPTRPLLEGLLLPVLGHVAGPGELAYLIQCLPQWEALGEKPYRLHPRNSLTLVPPEACTFVDPPTDPEEALTGEEEWLEAETGFRVREALAAYRRRQEAALRELTEMIPPLADPEGALAEARRRAEQTAGRLERAAWRGLRRAAGRPSPHRLASRWLFPLGKPQEKVLSLATWLARAGRRLVDELLALPVAGEHRFVIWEGEPGEPAPVALAGRAAGGRGRDGREASSG